jgi:hypothetical protein
MCISCEQDGGLLCSAQQFLAQGSYAFVQRGSKTGKKTKKRAIEKFEALIGMKV